MKRTRAVYLSLALGIAIPTVAFAQATGTSGMDMKSMGMTDKTAKQPTTATSHKGAGVVKSVNPTDGVVTLAHEPIKSLNWPAMTMGFKVKDKVLLDKVKPGDKVEFTLVQAGKDYVITSMK